MLTAGVKGGSEFDAVLKAAAQRSLAEGSLVEVSEGKLHAIAHPLISAGEGNDRLGGMAIARRENTGMIDEIMPVAGTNKM